jgi:alkylation response protein AidB-like acyl-CoA dehydrogenase
VDLEFTDEQEELRSSVRGFLERECPPSVVRSVHETRRPAIELWRAMVELDWPALNVPEAAGGMGLGFVEVAVVAEELGAAIAPVPYLATAAQFVPVVARAGDPDQAKRLLGPIATGERTGALAIADHPRRWRPTDVTAVAEHAPGGWVLTGEKRSVLVGEGEAADLVVVARAPEGIGLFVVPLGTAGVTVRPVVALDPSRPLADVAFDAVAVPGDRVLGTPGSPEVDDALERGVEQAAVALALEVVGACQVLLDLTVTHAKDRHQFGVPIGSFQAVKHRLAEAYIALERARVLAYFATAAIAEDDPRRGLAAAMAKAAADDCQQVICLDAIQTFGGIGFTWESDVHLYVKRAASSGALFGSATEHRLAVARTLGVGS